MSRSAVLIFNPAAGRRDALRLVRRLVEVLAQEGIDAEPRPTQAAGHATALAAEAARGGAQIVLAYGGDGTLREVAKGLLGTRVPLGPIPGGTTNVLRYALGLPRRPTRAARILAHADPRPMDVGLCGDEPFLMMVSGGLDARILQHQNPRWKALLGPPAVALAGLGQWWRDAYSNLEIEVEGRRLEGTFLSICNISQYGGPFRLAPEARFDDDRLDLVILRGARRARTLSFAFSLALGRHARRPDVTIQPVREVRLLAPEAPDLQIDGDPLVGVQTPVTIRLAAEKLWVVAGDQGP